MLELNSYSYKTTFEDKPSDIIENADELSMEAQELRRFTQDTRHRKLLVYWMIIVVSVWLTAVLLITIFNSCWGLNIDTKVLITLLATTTINVLGLSKIILSGLFGSSKRHRWNIPNK